MSKVWVDYEELWVPWEVEPNRPTYTDGTFKGGWDHVELPDELIARFLNAKKEMEDIWSDIREIMREQLEPE